MTEVGNTVGDAGGGFISGLVNGFLKPFFLRGAYKPCPQNYVPKATSGDNESICIASCGLPQQPGRDSELNNPESVWTTTDLYCIKPVRERPLYPGPITNKDCNTSETAHGTLCYKNCDSTTPVMTFDTQGTATCYAGCPPGDGSRWLAGSEVKGSDGVALGNGYCFLPEASLNSRYPNGTQATPIAPDTNSWPDFQRLDGSPNSFGLYGWRVKRKQGPTFKGTNFKPCLAPGVVGDDGNCYGTCSKNESDVPKWVPSARVCNKVGATCPPGTVQDKQNSLYCARKELPRDYGASPITQIMLLIPLIIIPIVLIKS